LRSPLRVGCLRPTITAGKKRLAVSGSRYARVRAPAPGAEEQAMVLSWGIEVINTELRPVELSR
jgi:hypothetical protein